MVLSQPYFSELRHALGTDDGCLHGLESDEVGSVHLSITEFSLLVQLAPKVSGLSVGKLQRQGFSLRAIAPGSRGRRAERSARLNRRSRGLPLRCHLGANRTAYNPVQSLMSRESL